MSVPYETIFCDTCGYEAISLVTAGKFIWSSGAEEFWFDRELALCEDCQGVVAMEKFPDRAGFDEAQKRHSSLWRGALRRYGKDEAGRLAEKEGFGVLEQVMKLQRPPVCLACGGSGVEPIRRPKGGSSDTSIRALGMSHPGCGGQLTIQGSGVNRIAPREFTRIYDTRGQLVVERPGWR